MLRIPATLWVACLFAAAMVYASGCSRTKYRLQADRDAYCAIEERNQDPRWAADAYNIDMDPRSRYFDQYDPDCSPMPPDDPTSHQYMHCVDGKKGWKHWHQNGQRAELENPIWQDALVEYTSVDQEGRLRLDIDSALRLAYVHSPDHQDQLETLYLTALDVTAERFRLDTQFFGGYDAIYNHNGSLVPAGLAYDNAAGKFVVTPPFDSVGRETNRLTLGRPNPGDPAIQARRRFATAGELLVGFANSFVFEFTGADANLSTSLLNFSFIQPLLRGAGRDVALEQLTFAERRLLSNLRAYGQYRQGFFTQIAIGELGVNGPQRGRPGTTLRSFAGQGGVGGFLGLLQQLQQIRNAEANLNLQIRTLSRLEAFLENGDIDPVQVEQFRQNIQNDRDSLLRSRASYELSLDRYKSNTLGLPPDIEVQLDAQLLDQFQLIPADALAIQDRIFEMQRTLAQIGNAPSTASVQRVVQDLQLLAGDVKAHFTDVESDLGKMTDVSNSDRATTARAEQIRAEQRRLLTGLAERKAVFAEAMAKLQVIPDGLTDGNTNTARNRLIEWVGQLLTEFDQTVLFQAGARLELVSVPAVDLPSAEALEVALANRLDFMNGRASLVDTWRLIQFNADALQGILNITADGQLRTAKNNPVSLRGPTGNVRLGVEFDAPFTRLLERNAYRESLVAYQRSRREFIQSRDGLSLGLRALLRQLKQLEASLEIQRRSVAISILRVDLTTKQLNAPPGRTQTGQRSQLNPTTAINLLSAQAALRNSQNSFLSVWLNYMSARMRLYRELGIMTLAPDGGWIEYPLPGAQSTSPSESSAPIDGEVPPLPPSVSNQFIDLLDAMPESSYPVSEATFISQGPGKVNRTAFASDNYETEVDELLLRVSGDKSKAMWRLPSH